MSDAHECGPSNDAEFFDALGAVFDRYPTQAQQYSIECIDHETDIMGIDFAIKTGIAHISTSNTHIVIEYQESADVSDDLICCKWWRESDSTWTCLKRWSTAVVPDPKMKEE